MGFLSSLSIVPQSPNDDLEHTRKKNLSNILRNQATTHHVSRDCSSQLLHIRIKQRKGKQPIRLRGVYEFLMSAEIE